FVAGPATPQLYTLSLHDALPISESASICGSRALIFLTMPPSWRSRRSLRLPKKAVSRRLSIEGPVWKQEKGARRPFSWQLPIVRSEEHTSELQSRENLVCRLLLE